MSGKVTSGSQWLHPAVPPADEKFLCKASTKTLLSFLCWCVEPHFFHTFYWIEKKEYLWSFLELVHGFVIRHLLQLVIRLNLRLLRQCQQPEFH